jgi:hypothetical protein
MDPITAIGIATTAYSAIKKGFEVGKEVESMAGDLGRWMNAINAVKTSTVKQKAVGLGLLKKKPSKHLQPRRRLNRWKTNFATLSSDSTV